MHTVSKIGSTYVARSAVIVGAVEMGDDCNVWHHAVLRGDLAPIRLGRRVNVQDGAILHCDAGVPLDIADDVAVAHRAIVHGRRVGSRTLIANGAIVLSNSDIGEDCIIAAGAVVPPRTTIPAGSIVMGVPAQIVRPANDKDHAYVRHVIESYLDLAVRHAAGEFEPYAANERS